MREIEWPEKQTGSINLMAFSRDATYLKVDLLHSMEFYLITQGWGHNSYDEHKFLFLCFENIHKGGA